MTRLLFVCLGNICRSPTAEAVMRHQVVEAGMEEDFEIDSAGILSAHQGEQADRRMRSHASRRGYDLTSISRPVIAGDFDRFDRILAMDRSNLSDLLSMAPTSEAKAKIALLLPYDPDCTVEEVPDPYYGGSEGFEDVLDLVEQGCTALLKDLLAS